MSTYKLTRRDHIEMLLRRYRGPKKLRWPNRKATDDFYRFRVIESQ